MDKDRKKEMISRIIIGLILIPLSIVIILYSSPLVFFLIILGLILLATKEIIPLVKSTRPFVRAEVVFASAIFIPTALFFKTYSILALYLFILLFIIFLIKMFSEEPTKDVMEDVSASFLASILVPFLFSGVFLIRDFSAMWVIYLFFVIWASDTFAYFTGVAFGKHRLIVKVSPKKSIEGLVGGMVAALIIGFLFNYFLLEKSYLWIFIITLDIIIAGVIGDLIESMLKRSAAVKDSGKLIPGHGGILDRFDSILFAAPVLYFYLLFLSGRFI